MSTAATRELFGRIVSALGLYPYESEPVRRLRSVWGRFLELSAERFPADLRERWEWIQRELREHAPSFERMTPAQAENILQSVYLVQQRLESMVEP